MGAAFERMILEAYRLADLVSNTLRLQVSPDALREQTCVGLRPQIALLAQYFWAVHPCQEMRKSFE